MALLKSTLGKSYYLNLDLLCFLNEDEIAINTRIYDLSLENSIFKKDFFLFLINLESFLLKKNESCIFNLTAPYSDMCSGIIKLENISNEVKVSIDFFIYHSEFESSDNSEFNCKYYTSFSKLYDFYNVLSEEYNKLKEA